MLKYPSKKVGPTRFSCIDTQLVLARPVRLRIFLEPSTRFPLRSGIRVPENRKISTQVANPDKVELDFETDGEGEALSLQRLSLVGSA